jgi:hypothetical protein
MKLYSKEHFVSDSDIYITDISDKEMLDRYITNLDNTCDLGINTDYVVAYRKSNLSLDLGVVCNSKKAEFNLHDLCILVSTQNVNIINNDNKYKFEKLNSDKEAYVHTCIKYYTTYPKTHYGPEYELRDHIIYCF